MLRIGRYGNADDQGPGLPNTFISGVAVTDKYIYIGDISNRRLLRGALVYAVEETITLSP
jgi:hypothetical protein